MPGGRGKKLYPYDKWFKKTRSFTLTRHKDFECMVRSMEQQLRTAATQRKLKISIQNLDDEKSLKVTVLGQKKRTKKKAKK